MKFDEAKKYKLIIIILIAFNISLLSIGWILNFKNDKKDDKQCRREHRREVFIEALHLDSMQITQFDTLNNSHFQKVALLNDKIDSLKIIMQNEIIKTESNQLILDSLFLQIATYRTTIDTSIFQHFKRLRAICKPNQTEAFDSIINSFLIRKEPKRNDPPKRNQNSATPPPR